jgi:hypothetical protein
MRESTELHAFDKHTGLLDDTGFNAIELSENSLEVQLVPKTMRLKRTHVNLIGTGQAPASSLP